MENEKILRILITFAFLTFVIGLLNAQVPQSLNYQAMLRNESGQILQNQNSTVKLSVHQATLVGAIVYEETHGTTTDNYGLVNLQIGQGNPVSGVFQNIQWGTDNYFLQVQVDIGYGFVDLGTTQFVTVPYALVADTVLHGGADNWGTQSVQTDNTLIGSGTLENQLKIASQGANDGQILKWNGSSWIPGNDQIGEAIKPGVILLDNTNYLTVMIDENDIINIRENIIISDNYQELNEDGTLISGGSFVGTGIEEISFGDNSMINGVDFNNLLMDGSQTTVFIGCNFDNVNQLGYECTFIGCRFNNCILTSTLLLGYLTDCEIDDCTFPRFASANHCDFSNCTLGGSSFGEFTGNDVGDCLLYPESVFVGNRLDDSKVVIQVGSDLSITGNFFTGLYTGANELIQIDYNDSDFMNVNISGNTFNGNSSTSRYIYLNGSYTGTYGLVKISDNTFIRGTQAIVNSSSGMKTVITNNALKSSSLGVSNGGDLVVRDNDAF